MISNLISTAKSDDIESYFNDLDKNSKLIINTIESFSFDCERK